MENAGPTVEEAVAIRFDASGPVTALLSSCFGVGQRRRPPTGELVRSVAEGLYGLKKSTGGGESRGEPATERRTAE